MTEPLPYIVKLRTVVSDDAPAVVSDVRMLAYGPMEAVLQATIQVLGQGIADASRCKVESVGPDLEAWRKMREEEKARDSKK